MVIFFIFLSFTVITNTQMSYARGVSVSASASNVSYRTATLTGTLSVAATPSNSAIEWSTSSTLSTYTSCNDAQSGDTFTCNVTGLTPGGVYYYYRAVYIGSTKTTYGTIQSFYTQFPTVTTNAVSGVTSTSATLSGSTTDTQAPASEVGFEYWTTNPQSGTYVTASNFSSGTMTETLTGLLPNTTYSYTAYEEPTPGNYQSANTVTFTTPNTPSVSVTTSPATSVTSNSATFSGTTTDASATTSNTGFEFSTSSTFASGNTNVNANSINSGTFTASQNGLSSGTTYYVRAWENQSGTDVYGSSQTFTTPSGSLSVTAPTLMTPFPSSVTLTGQPLVEYATLSNWQCSDTTGTGNGWHVTVSASPLTEQAPSGGFAAGTTALQLPSDSLYLNGTRTLTANSGSMAVQSTGPTITNPGAAIDTGTAVTVVTSDAGTGEGTYTVNEPNNGLKLVLNPATTKVDLVNYPSGPTVYSTTITFSIISGP